LPREEASLRLVLNKKGVIITNVYREKQCPVCGYTLAATLFETGKKPLATIAWADSYEAALRVPSFEQEYIQCLNCSHVWNHLFDWEHVPYGDKPNKMYNRGARWREHLIGLSEWLSQSLPSEPVVIDIGCGDGSFLVNMADSYQGKGRFVGFDPSGDVDSGVQLIDFYKCLFEPFSHLKQLKPDLLLMRHVIEHLTAPSSFLHSLSWASDELAKPIHLYCEVPCIDRVFEAKRLSDFYYEHPSQFTTESFRHLLSSAGNIISIYHSYDGEVICGLVELCPGSRKRSIQERAVLYSSSTRTSITTISSQLRTLLGQDKKLAIWGGTGKCSAFMHHYGVSCEDIQIVVDSDIRKIGTFVPGVGQEIKCPAELLTSKPDILIIPTQWRVQDILIESLALKVTFEKVLIEHNGKLIDFYSGEHPYEMNKIAGQPLLESRWYN
jgi:C-methyltransferase C-terminal domain/Methyltransferase domain